MSAPAHDRERPVRRWGDAKSMLDDDEARRLLIEAASRCIVRRGNAAIRMSEVAEEAGVARSTLYRYFPRRDDLIVGLLLGRVDAALARVAAGLPHPDDAVRSLPDLVLEPIALVDGSALNEALFSVESGALVTFIELGSDQLMDAGYKHFGPLLEQWQREGQLRANLDLHETMHWLNAVSLHLLTPRWRVRSEREKREFLDQYLVPALVSEPKPPRRRR